VFDIVVFPPGSIRRRSSIGLTSAVLALSPTVQYAAAQDLVQNPGFEETTDNYTSPGWTVAPDNGGTQFIAAQAGDGEGSSSGIANTGVYFAAFGATDATSAMNDVLSQAITTMPGMTYIVSFFLANTAAYDPSSVDADGISNRFVAMLDGQTVLSLTNVSAFGYTQYSAPISVTSDNALLSFTGEQVPGYFNLDDVSVDAAPAPITGGGIVSFGMAAAALAVRRVRAKKSQG
jgi:hypothetical protein